MKQRAGLLVGLLLVLFQSASVLAQIKEAHEQPVALAMVPWAVRPRTGGPITMRLVLTNRTESIIRGSLRLTPFYETTGQTTTTILLEELTLRPGDQIYRTTIPPADAGSFDGGLQITAVFDSEDGVIDLGTQAIASPQLDQRSLVIMVSDPWGGSMRHYEDVISNLRIEQFKNAAVGIDVQGLPSRLHPDKLPTSALAYCDFDLLVLAGQGFAMLDIRRLDAILKWVRAGGALYVHLDTPVENLSAKHVLFLTQLLGERTLPMVGSGAAEPMFCEVGVGRAVLVNAKHPEDIDWRRIAMYLWYLRRAQINHINQTDGAWSEKMQRLSLIRQQQLAYGYYGRQQYESLTTDDVSYGIDEPPIVGGLSQGLMPDQIRIMPIWVICLILAGFVLFIGPGDYLLLGLINRRKFTWILLPVATVVTTMIIVSLSEDYMGRTTHTASLTLIDYGQDGNVVRTNQFTQIFAGRNFSQTETYRDAIVTRMAAGNVDQFQWGGVTGPLSDEGSSYSGNIPTSYQITQTIRQWQPTITRVLRFDGELSGGTSAESPIDWADVDPALLQTLEGRRKLEENLDIPWMELVVMHQDRFYGGHSSGEASEHEWRFNEQQHLQQDGDLRTKLNLSGAFYKLNDALQQMCVRERFGWFSVAGRISPTGSNNFEDVTLLDATDPSQWLLVICEKRGDDFYIHRRLYTIESTPEGK